jgi:gliding motility-associated transport system ATP-binding protein
MRACVVDVQNLVKWYGPRLAVRDVSFSVAEGEVVGLLGPNGSGKSTIFRILTGYLVPTTGSAAVAGLDATTQSLALRHQVGYVPEDAPLYDHMRVYEHLRFMANLKGLFGRSATLAIETVAERLQLRAMAEVPVSKLSRGYRQRVAIGQALLNDPKLLIFDEPTSGLDPSQVIAIRDLIRELAGKRTVLMASHVLPEIEQIANRVMILLNGRLLTTDALAQAADGLRLRLFVAGPEPVVRETIAAVPGVRSIVVEPGSGGAAFHYLVEADQRPEVPQELAAALVGRGLALSELATVRPDLERTFLQLTRQPSEAAA